MAGIGIQETGVAERDRPHDLDHGGEDTQAYLKYNECIGLSEVEGLGRGIRVQFLWVNRQHTPIALHTNNLGFVGDEESKKRALEQELAGRENFSEAANCWSPLICAHCDSGTSCACLRSSRKPCEAERTTSALAWRTSIPGQGKFFDGGLAGRKWRSQGPNGGLPGFGVEPPSWPHSPSLSSWERGALVPEPGRGQWLWKKKERRGKMDREELTRLGEQSSFGGDRKGSQIKASSCSLSKNLLPRPCGIFGERTTKKIPIWSLHSKTL